MACLWGPPKVSNDPWTVSGGRGCLTPRHVKEPLAHLVTGNPVAGADYPGFWSYLMMCFACALLTLASLGYKNDYSVVLLDDLKN